ncbi:MAG: bifunctional 5,10-methylenetetrahydrofolate dehydrogenase/5,10-methenyltetrahydrofolate cyclohydrolase [Candidatus Izemoplasmatales bacterium]|jgi:methylenetetrahydrofolate dehydrogenase (NADP+)/methenyltetrahydrofolate cyclohydrolase|nr:bifunctional 5,10-methylenetetrahydrofolate dehydrogenase/5,10-methenyltetrahydrofolate cyclohydrolase [Candidatus Izemoplasmatales bacterium]MDD5293004.1 bifunctional 5,10-methylenetetrahydrofolate dehydrogenase/5,10-methenyltetrahydrofolate cyclohydrolase [Candidatus Izemoplasmatales bacterium]
MATILDGKQLAKEIKDNVRMKVLELERTTNQRPHLVVVLVGDDAASETYVSGKEKAAEITHIQSTVIRKGTDASEAELIELLRKLNNDPLVHGILLQLPLPKHLHQERLIAEIDPRKDVDGFTPENVAKLVKGQAGILPCTPLGIMRLLKKYAIDPSGKNACVIGRSQIVGKPMASLLLEANATVTICHSKTKNIQEISRNSDIVVVAIGKPEYVDDTFVRPGAVVIDVGISRVDGKLKGDVAFDLAARNAGFITPVPGGVGPMTIACLMENTLTCFMNQMGVSG